MTEIHRRGFFARSVAAGTGLIGFLYPGLPGIGQASASQGQQAGTPVQLAPDPRYAGGVVTAMTPGGDYVVSSAEGARIVAIDQAAEVWREVTGGPELIEIGDRLDVLGVPQEDGRLAATSGRIFANIARFDGVLVSTAGSSVTVKVHGTARKWELSPLHEAIRAEDGSDYPGGAMEIPSGATIGAVGLSLPNGGFRVTRVWA